MKTLIVKIMNQLMKIKKLNQQIAGIKQKILIVDKMIFKTNKNSQVIN